MMLLPTVIKIPIKIILFPIRLCISIFTGVTGFILDSAIINFALYIISGIIFLFFLGVTWSSIFVVDHMHIAARILIPCLFLLASYLTNPFSGGPKHLRHGIERIRGFNEFLGEI